MPSFMSVKNDFDSTSDIHPERIINVPGNVLRHSLFKKKNIIIIMIPESFRLHQSIQPGCLILLRTYTR